MKYTYSVSNNTVYCMTHFAGKTVRGIAKCDPTDEFNLEDGKRLSRARCNYKVAVKKLNIKNARLKQAVEDLAIAKIREQNAQDYVHEAELFLEECIKELDEVESSL